MCAFVRCTHHAYGQVLTCEARARVTTCFLASIADLLALRVPFLLACPRTHAIVDVLSCRPFELVGAQSPAVGQSVTRQARPVVSQDEPGAHKLDAQPTECSVLTGIAVSGEESGRSGERAVRSLQEE